MLIDSFVSEELKQILDSCNQINNNKEIDNIEYLEYNGTER